MNDGGDFDSFRFLVFATSRALSSPVASGVAESHRLLDQFFSARVHRLNAFQSENCKVPHHPRLAPITSHVHIIPAPKMKAKGKQESFDGAATSRKVYVDQRSCEDETSDPILQRKHKIFLSHSGSQKEFVEHLCSALESRCRYPFFDKRRSSLPKGETFANLIFQGVEQCEILVVVISDEYFMSKWPMMELHAFVEALEAIKIKPANSRQKYILPLFYDMSVEEFRDKRTRMTWFKQWETFAEDGDKKRRIDVNAWKRALDVLGAYNGISYNRELQEIKAYEDEIVSHICGKISADVKWDDSHVQGKSEICEVLCEKIQSVGRTGRYRCKMVGIFGVGGMGKTTICKTLCNELSDEYEGRVCHVELDTEATTSSLVKSLQKVVIVLTDKNSEFVQDMDEGRCRDILRNSAASQRTFLALDNVWDNHGSILQAKAILEAPKFHEDSLVIVTARSRSTLEMLGIRGDACIEMPGLGEADAAKLFLHHAAGGKQFAGEEEKRDIVRCIKRCYFEKGSGAGFHYHPLALQSLGVQLGCVGEKPSEWVEKLSRVRNFSYLGGGNPVFDILRSGFDLLRPSEQSLFMDLLVYRPFHIWGCYFGSEWGDMVEWLCLVYREGEEEMKSRIDALKRKGLVQDVDWSSGRIGVHDLYVEFARLEAEGMLDVSTDFEHRRCIYIRNGDLRELERRASGGCWQKLIRLGFDESRWNYSAEGQIRSLEGIEWQFFSNVVVLELQGLACVRGSLNLEGLKCLRSLWISEVRGLDRVEGLEGLRGLTFFKWDNHPYVECKTRIVGQLPASLQVLDVNVGVWLEPDVFVRCSNLYELNLDNVQAVELDLRSCSSLQSVCVSVTELRTLWLPLTARGVCSLKCLKLWYCCIPRQLRDLDYWCCGFEQLEVLSLYLGMDIEGDAINLKGLEHLPALRRLTLGGWKVSSGWPDLSRSRKLVNLYLVECEGDLQEEDIRMLVSLPLLQPVEIFDGFESANGMMVKLDLVRRKVLGRNFCLSTDDWKVSDLGKPPVKINLGAFEGVLK